MMNKITIPKETYDLVLEYISLNVMKQAVPMAWSDAMSKRGTDDEIFSALRFFEDNNFEVNKDIPKYINVKLRNLYEQIINSVLSEEDKEQLIEILSDDLLASYSAIAFQNLVAVPKI